MRVRSSRRHSGRKPRKPADSRVVVRRSPHQHSSTVHRDTTGTANMCGELPMINTASVADVLVNGPSAQSSEASFNEDDHEFPFDDGLDYDSNTSQALDTEISEQEDTIELEPSLNEVDSEFRVDESLDNDPDTSRAESGHQSQMPNAAPSSSTTLRRTGKTTRWVNGHKYTQANKSSVKLSFRCSHYRTGCKGKCDFLIGSGQYVNFCSHTCKQTGGPIGTTHTTNMTRDVTEEMKRETDKLAISSSASRNAVWDIVRAKFYGSSERNEGVIGLSEEQVLRRVHRARFELHGGNSLQQIESKPWSQVLGSDGNPTDVNFYLFNFMYYDRVDKKRHRLLGWGHPILLNMLKQKKTSVFVDGTFRCVPPHFKQCLVLLVYDRPTKSYYPAAFVLATSKKYETYFHALRIIVDFTDYAMDPEHFYCDFEAGMIRAIKDHFPSSVPIGCLFHFKQACRRKMKKYRISDKECKIAMTHGVLDMLTVVPQNKVAIQGIKWVQNKIKEECRFASIDYSTAKWREFWNYFERTWIDTYPPSLWNVQPHTNELIARTNNPLERFNRELNSVFEGAHPSLPNFVVGIESIARRYANQKEDIEMGRARIPERLPILLPDPVDFSDVELHAEEADNHTQRRTPNVLRSARRARIARNTAIGLQPEIENIGRASQASDYYEDQADGSLSDSSSD